MTATWPAELIDALSFGLVLLDDKGRILASNRAAEELIEATLPEGEDFFARFESLDGAANAKKSFVAGHVAAAFPDVLQVMPEEEDNFRFIIRIRSFEDNGKRFGVAIVERSAVVFGIRDAKHELNNALMGLMGHTELLKGQTDLTDQARKKVDSISGEVEGMRKEVAELGKLAYKIAKQ